METVAEFRLGKVNDTGLYTTFRYVNGTLNSINNQRLRTLVADYIGKNKDLHLIISRSGTQYKAVTGYCEAIEKYNLPGGCEELTALSMLSRISIRLVSKRRTSQDNYIVRILTYGDEIDSFKECVYILYDEENKHYIPLCTINKENQIEQTIFQRNDKTILKLLTKFIHEELHDHTFEEFEYERLFNQTEQSTELSLNDNEQITSDIIQLEAHKISPVERKSRNHTELTFAEIIRQDFSLSSLLPTKSSIDVCDEPPTKIAKWDNCQMSILSEANHDDSSTIEQHLQIDFSLDELMEVEMRFEVEPASGFRGRTPGDFKDGKPPRYFADRNNRHYLKLLIPETYLLADLFQNCIEICLVTQEIRGYTYIHPYFVFQIHPTDRQAPYLNPIYKYIHSTTDLEAYSNESLREMILKLVIIMHRHRELMQTEQPLKIFSSSGNNTDQPPISTIYTKYSHFKNAYQLQDVRFAITLWQKLAGEKVYKPCEHRRYISEISTEDREFKSPKK